MTNPNTTSVSNTEIAIAVSSVHGHGRSRSRRARTSPSGSVVKNVSPKASPSDRPSSDRSARSSLVAVVTGGTLWNASGGDSQSGARVFATGAGYGGLRSLIQGGAL